MRFLSLAFLAAAFSPAALTQETPLSGAALIDQGVRAKWQELGFAPAARAGDAEFVRRLYLDLVGEIPRLEETEKFLADTSSTKRARLVDALLQDPRYASHWADVWTGVLLGFDEDRRDNEYRQGQWDSLRGEIAKNVPYDEFARKVITTAGTSEKDGLLGYVVRVQRESGQDFPKALAGKVTRAFMGIQIQCAQCHDHPFDKWTQEEFYGMASFFTEVGVRREKAPDGKKQGAWIVEDKPRGGGRGKGGGKGGDLTIPDSKSGPIKSSFLETGKGVVDGKLRRETFARYVTEKDNLQFAKMAVNRFWAHFLGAGIVNPVDDFNGRNKPTHPELLEALAKDFMAHGYDLHWLIKAIATSEAYSLTSRAKARDPQAERYLALARVRALSPEQILRSVFAATGFAEPKGKADPRRGASGLISQFRFAFADDEGTEVSEFQGTIPSALLMMNSDALSRASSASAGTLSRILSVHKAPPDRVRAIFLAALTRPPTDKEAARWTAHVGRASGNAGYEDVLWTLLNTSEFLFNH